MPHTRDITTLPTLDLSLLDGSPAQRQAFLDDLRHAARDVGFLYLTGHGIDSILLKQVQGHARQFFALPDHEKAAVGMINSPHFRGYNRAASEVTRGKPDLRERSLVLHRHDFQSQQRASAKMIARLVQQSLSSEMSGFFVPDVPYG